MLRQRKKVQKRRHSAISWQRAGRKLLEKKEAARIRQKKKVQEENWRGKFLARGILVREERTEWIWLNF
jgi:adenylate cyclase class IV